MNTTLITLGIITAVCVIFCIGFCIGATVILAFIDKSKDEDFTGI